MADILTLAQPTVVHLQQLASGWGILEIRVDGLLATDTPKQAVFAAQPRSGGGASLEKTITPTANDDGVLEAIPGNSRARLLKFTITPADLATVASNAGGYEYAVRFFFERAGATYYRDVQTGKFGARAAIADKTTLDTAVSLAITGTATGTVGQTDQLTATVLDVDGDPVVDAEVTWSSSNTNVATVDATGLVEYVAPGTATITASCQSVSDTATATCTDPAFSAADAEDVITYDSGWTPTSRSRVVGSVDRARGRFDVKDPTYGAIGNGVADDKAAAQAALTAAVALGAGTVHLPAGTFLLDVPSDTTGVLSLTGSLRIIGAGKKATRLKIKNAAAGRYYAMIYSAPGNTMEDFSITDLTLDGNATGDHPDLADDLLTTPNYRCGLLLSGTLSRVTIERVRFTDFACTNTIATNNGTIEEVRVQDCTFDEHGRTDAGYHDHSTVYLSARKVWVVNNVFEGRATGKGGLACAIETHAEEQVVEGNSIDSYELGMWVTGSRSAAQTSNDSRVAFNRIRNVKNGIRVLSNNASDLTDHATYIDGLLITGNEVEIDRDAWAYTILSNFSQWSNGISVWHGTTGGIRNLRITDNVVRFKTFATALDGSSTYANYSNGITIHLTNQDAAQEMAQLVVRGNIISDSPSAGILCTANVTGLDISDNWIYRPGKDTTRSANFRSPIYVAGTADYSAVNSNHCIDLQGTPSMQTGINLLSSSALESECLDNVVRIGTSNFAQIVTGASATNDAWFIRARARGTTYPSAIRARHGSRYIQENAGRVYEQTTAGAGVTWQLTTPVKLSNQVVGTSQTTIAHTLPYTPTDVVVVNRGASAVAVGRTGTAPDATNVYLIAASATNADVYVR